MNFNSFDLHRRPLIWAPSSQEPISKQISHINETLVVFLADSQGSVGYTVYLTFVCIMQYLIRHYVAIQKYLCYIQCFTFQSCFT